jgi:hypothetical protein
MARLARNKLLAFALVLVAIQLLLAVGAPLLAPYDPMACGDRRTSIGLAPISSVATCSRASSTAIALP